MIEEGELKASYLYNDNGQRTNKTIHHADTSTTTTLYHYDQLGQLVSETTEAGTPTREYIWHENGEAKAQIDTSGGNDTVIYLHSDHLLTTRGATDQGQQVIWRWQGEAFGNTEPDEIGGMVINLRFPGQYFDKETGLHYNGFRYYDPTSGRYITSDPIGLYGSINTYVYVRANPIRYIDTYGLVKIAPPTDSNGNQLPPKAKLPPGKNGQPNEWVPIPGSGTGDRATKWKPRYPVDSPSGGQPGASWDPNGHFDVDDGPGSRERLDAAGQPVGHEMRAPTRGEIGVAAVVIGVAGCALFAEFCLPALGATAVISAACQ